MVLERGVVNGSGTGVVHDGSGIAGLSGHDPTLIFPTGRFDEAGGSSLDSGKDSIATADWLDVTHAMLDSIDDLNAASG